MRVEISIKQVVEYVGVVTMTKAEFDQWELKLKEAGMYGDGEIAEDILETYGRETGMRLGEPNDWGQLSVDTFNPLKRSASDRGEKR